MKASELLARLQSLENLDFEISCSVDMSDHVVDENIEARVFGTSLIEVQEENTKEVTLIFELASKNFTKYDLKQGV
jgi:hypothetical protein